MSIIINEVARRTSDVNGFYRVEDYYLNGMSYGNVGLTALRSQIMQFANSGNCRGIIISLSGLTTYLASTRDVILDLEEAKTVGSINTTTDYFTITGHGLTNDTKVRFTSSGTLATGLSVTGTYYVINATTDTFQVSATIGGTRVNMSGTPTGTCTCWITRQTKIKTAEDIVGVRQKYFMR